MYGPELVFEIFNFEWKHVLTFLNGNMTKNVVCKTKFITQKLLTSFLPKTSNRHYFARILKNKLHIV